MKKFDHAAPAFGEDISEDALMAELCHLEDDVGRLETKALRPGMRRAARRGGPDNGANVKDAVVAIGKEVVRQGKVIDTMSRNSAVRPAAAARSPLLRREPGDPTDLRAAHDLKMRTWQAHQQLNDRRLREAKRTGSSDVLTRNSLARHDDVLDRIGRLERQLVVKANRPPGLGARYDADSARPGAAAKALHKQAVVHWLRTGQESYKGADLRELQKKALNTELNPDGGYIVLNERESSPLDAFLLELSMMRQRATVRTISTNELVRPINMKGANAGWVAERGARPETDSPVLAQDRFPVMELYAEPAATQTLLDDAAIDVEAWLAQEVVDAFALQESPAFMTGTGGTQPRGLLSYPFLLDHTAWAHGSFRLVETGVDGGFPTFDPLTPTDPGPQDVLLDTIYALKAGHRQNATWLMNRATIGVLRKFKDANGIPLWQPSTQAGQPPTLEGFTIDEDEYMPDIATDVVAIGFGDWKKTYLILDRIGVRVLRDPYTNKPFVLFYTTKRVGGGVQYFDAAVFLRFSAP